MLFVLPLCACEPKEPAVVEREMDVDAGGHTMHMLIAGEKGPVVVLESGLPGEIGWRTVRRNVGQFAQVVTYARAGFGKSEVGSGPRDAKRIAGELRTALHNARLAGPYVMVGHSMGGPYVRVFAGMYPEEVAGMVLVDPTEADTYESMESLHAWFVANHPELWARVEELAKLAAPGMESMNWTMAAMIKNTEEFLATVPAGRREKMRDSFWGQIDAMKESRKNQAAMKVPEAAKAEFAAGNESFVEAMAAVLPRVPVVLIAADKAQMPMDFSAVMDPNVSALQEGMREKHLGRYREWVGKVGGKMVVTQKSGHDIPDEDPEVVVGVIREIIEKMK